ncbi:hypothetical protein KC725_02260 [Candidatus Peregrinibacteria bacterium]|nr:hypothetical protein [Candidatus Peregrinibacteria bacterium]
MANFSDMLKQVRETDEQSEVQKNKEKQTLHSSRIQKYIEEHELTADNFGDKFDFDSALELLRMKKTRGESLMEQELVSAKEYLDKLDENGTEMMSDSDHDTFKSNLHALLEEKKALDHEKDISLAHQKYLLIRSLVYKRVSIQSKFESKREDKKVEITKGLKDGFSDKWKEIKKNYRKMSKGEKAVAVGALVIGTIWLFSQSDNPKIQKVKEYAWKGLKLAGAGVGINYAWKLFTGKTAVDALDNYASSTAGNAGFFKEAFKTDDEGGELMQRSFTYMHDEDILDMAKRYRQARANKIKKIEVASVAHSDMTPEEIYTAVDTFFKRHPIDEVEKRFKNEKSDQRKWSTAAATLMGEDGRFEADEPVLDRAYENVRYGWHTSLNYIGSTAGWKYVKDTYRDWTGKEVNDTPPAEFKDWFKDFFGHSIQSEAKLSEYVKGETKAKSSQNLVDVVDHGQVEGNVKHLKGTDSHYAMVRISLNDIEKNTKAAGDAWNKSMKRLEEFFGDQYPDYKDKINKYIVPETGCCIVDSREYVFFARMPLPNSAEFQSLEFGKRTNLDLMKDKDLETFEGKMTFDKLESWEKDQFRILYGLDASQIGADTDKIFAEITKKYEALAVPILKMKQDILNDEDLRDEMLKKAGVEPKLRGNRTLLADIEEIEKDEAASVTGAGENYARVIAEMKRLQGNTFRLAILGDEKARKQIKWGPVDGHISSDSAFEAAKNKYRESCRKYVKEFNQG